ncbi:unnamed protein product [Nippostrongylus brasiliensis]|uniref:Uncharacterized protein n=1 Tax=Nippostrongylus brasiliensis TaxID=27835 RepID=A0A0N4XW14_NIPBR|nr:unnamed protein product [Nippostrongylus brasiliensis]
MPFQFSPPVPAKLTNVRLSREQIQALTETIAQSVAASFTVVPAVPPTFRNHDLKNQFYFNSEIIQLLQAAQTELDLQQTSASLKKATSLLIERNEFLVSADKDPSVWEYYEMHRQAERFKTSNPILASYFKEKMKKYLRPPMGVLSHLFSLCVGAYGGAFFAQNYEIAKLPSISELAKKLEVYLQEYRKDR